MNKVKYWFNGDVYFSEEEVSEAICEHILDCYPEEVHSDYLPEESALFVDIWNDEVEIIES